MKAILIVLIALLVILVGCQQKKAEPLPQIVNTTPITQKVAPQPANLSEQRISSEAEVKLTDCDRRQGEQFRDWCYRDVARTLKEPAICTKISYSPERISCFSILARTLKNSTFCSLISDDLAKMDCERGTG
jgi:hypothetical protein